MSRGIRTFLIWVCALVALGSAVGLVILRTGRPLFYTDGAQSFRADSLRDRSMLVWEAPEVLCELPGPVQGRFTRLDTGEFVYARVGADGTTDLVRFDPRRPESEPAPLGVLNAVGRHDLAPAYSESEGVLYFASDREGGAGGYDLYAATVVDGLIGLPERLDDRFNGPADEVDPAPAPNTDELAFVRRQGERSALWIGRREGTEAAIRLEFEDGPEDDLGAGLVRDPAFAPDGTALWFARQVAGARPALLRTWRHEGAFVTPVRELGHSAWRSPLPRGDGFVLELLQPRRAAAPSVDAERSGAVDALVYVARAREVYPWWEGQSALELGLLVALLLSLLLIALLLLGKRWRQLDIVTWCILISALLHFLVLMLVGGLELTLDEIDRPGDADGGRLQVQFLSAAEMGAGAAQGALQGSDVHAAMPAFRGRAFEESLDEVRPTGELGERAALDASRMLADATERAAPSAADLRPETPAEAASHTMQDAADVSAPRSAADAATATSAATTLAAMAAPTEHAASTTNTARATRATEQMIEEVVRPSTAALAARPRPQPIDLSGPAARPLPTVAVDRTAKRPDQAPQLREPEAAASVAAAARRAEQDAAPAVSSARDLVAAAPAAALMAARPRSMPRSALATPRPAGPSASLQRPRGSLAAAPAFSEAAAPRRTVQPQRRDDRPAAVALADRREQPSARERSAVAKPTPRAVTQPVPLAFSAPREATHSVRRARIAHPDPQTGLTRLAPPSSRLAAAPKRGADAVAAVAAPSRASVAPELYQNRSGPAKAAALRQFGGTVETERAVANGLRYLASVQNRGGYWGSQRHRDGKYGSTHVGKSALCVLAFLGGGHTHQSRTEYSDHVARGLAFLLAQQDARTGHFGRTSSYSHGITTYALAECYALTNDEALREPLERAVAWILANQDDSRDTRSRGGWGYFSSVLRPEDGYARTSVTSWMIMALESAKIGGIAVPERSLSQAEDFLWRMFDRERGYVLYSKDPSRLRSNWRTLPASTPAAAFCLMLLGADRSDGRLEDAMDYTVDRRPRRYRRASTDRFVRNAEGNIYFWYYGSLASLLAGGEVWEEWNEALKSVLVPAQNEDGSFSPVGAYASYAGDTDGERSYTTAMIVLSLEVYYRYFTPLLRK